MNKATTKIKISGQAMIVLILVVALASFWLMQVSILNLGSVGLDNEFVEGFKLLTKAEGYLENAALKLLRNPNYPGGNLQEGSISCTIEISTIGQGKDLSSFCQKGERIKKMGMVASIVDGVYQFTKIEERE